MNDNYSHVEEDLFYITENILGPCDNSVEYERLQDDFNSVYEHCQCLSICSVTTCKCLENSCGDNYQVCQDRYKLVSKPNSYPLVECNDICTCSTECGNRVVQKGPFEGLDIRICDKGFGLFATSAITAGTFICEYAGEILTSKQASLRHDRNRMMGKSNYIFCLRELSGSNTVITIIDPSIFGNIGRYINHSCDPNSHILPVRCGSPIPKLAIFACKDISVDEEITFHYGLDGTDVVNENDRIKCLCKAQNCRGFIPFQNY
ncbi:unnamed protein product [Spodoptera exigua]|nr:unnamed protein product [Spodoptera exigua]